MKKISILGSTGSIGTQTLDVLRKNDDLQVVALAAGTRKFTWSCPWYSGTRSYTCSGNIPSGITPPSGLSATLNSKTYNSATIKVSLSSYGNPSSTDGRYIEAAILNQNSYGASYRWSIAKNTTSSTLTVNNSSSSNPSSFRIGSWSNLMRDFLTMSAPVP